MKRALIILLGITWTGFLSANTTLETTKTSTFNSILNHQENRINRAFDLRYISYNEYENLYYQLEDIEDYQFRALIDYRIDYREERILNDLIYSLDSRLDQIFHRRMFCVNYYQPIYLRRQHYTNHYHHYRKPKVRFNVTIDYHSNGSNHYNDRYRENNNHRYNNNRNGNQRNESRQESNRNHSQQREKRTYQKTNETRNNQTKEKSVNKLDKRRVYSNQRN